MKIIKNLKEETNIVRPKIIAIDFDQTITEGDSFPDANKTKSMFNAKKYINLLHKEGYYIIIWTCRFLPEHIQNCVDFLKNNGIEYDAINENYSNLDFKPYPKIYYDYIIDDKDHFLVDWLQEYYKIHTRFCNSTIVNTTPEMRDHFYTRTINHIESVQSFYVKYLLKNNYEIDFQNDKIWKHDYSKFCEPEIMPYIIITWNYFCKEYNLDFIISDSVRQLMNEATEHHIRENPHHPEYWDPNKYNRSLIAKDERDKFDPNSMEIVDATAMPERYLIEMCADWCATGQERRNTPFEWADKVINHRWKFTKDQTDFVYNTLKEMWT